MVNLAFMLWAAGLGLLPTIAATKRHGWGLAGQNYCIYLALCLLVVLSIGN